MEKRYIMTAFGMDRPGVVADVTELLYECGCNLEDSTMTRLADEFAVILLFTSRKAGIEETLAKECRRLEREKGISAFFREAERGKGKAEGNRALHSVRVEGVDHTGIVYRVSRLLASLGANIENLSSNIAHSPESGTARYRMEILVKVPGGVSLDELRRALSRTGEELDVDIALE
jgi:glycine cleavage system transcriptional repressor